MNAAKEKNAKGKCAVGLEHMGPFERAHMSKGKNGVNRTMGLFKQGVTEITRPIFVPCTASYAAKPAASSLKGGKSRRRKTRRRMTRKH